MPPPRFESFKLREIFFYFTRSPRSLSLSLFSCVSFEFLSLPFSSKENGLLITAVVVVAPAVTRLFYFVEKEQENGTQANCYYLRRRHGGYNWNRWRHSCTFFSYLFIYFLLCLSTYLSIFFCLPFCCRFLFVYGWGFFSPHFVSIIPWILNAPSECWIGASGPCFLITRVCHARAGVYRPVIEAGVLVGMDWSRGGDTFLYFFFCRSEYSSDLVAADVVWLMAAVHRWGRTKASGIDYSV